MAWDSAQSFGSDAQQSNVARKGIAAKSGTTAENDAYTGVLGEITVDTDKNQFRLHDGSTAGGAIFNPTLIGAVTDLPTAHLQHQETSGTGGGATVNTTWNVRTLNTEVHDNIGITLGSSIFTLPAGTYDIEAWSMVDNADINRLRLYDVTGTAVHSYGLNAWVNDSVSGWSYGKYRGRVAPSAANQYRFDHYTQVGTATTGLGIASSLGTEIFADVFIKQVA
jgi:hypothetical protein